MIAPFTPPQTQNPVLSAVEHRMTAITDCQRDQLSADFSAKQFAKMPNFLGPTALELLCAEAEKITQAWGHDKNFLMKNTSNTPRQMRTVSQHLLKRESKYIPNLYGSEALRLFLSHIAGEEVFRVPWPPEEYVMTALCQQGDTHGWHWDNYSFALILFLKAPKAEDGGLVQTCAGGHWDKNTPQINQTLLANPIHTYRCNAGDAYLLHTKDLLHRVTPITGDSSRLIINMAWASASDLKEEITHETTDLLFET
jgi:hypothetical protein